MAGQLPRPGTYQVEALTLGVNTQLGCAAGQPGKHAGGSTQLGSRWLADGAAGCAWPAVGRIAPRPRLISRTSDTRWTVLNYLLALLIAIVPSLVTELEGHGLFHC